MAPFHTILVFDSGLGGLTVHAEIMRRMPHAHCIYIADDAAFPYGALPSDQLIHRVHSVMQPAIETFTPDIVVIACNTASTICLPSLRGAFSSPFVGTVPAVKPAAAISRTRTISVLGTPGTVTREYTHDLIIAHAADCRVTLVGAPNLATLAEAYLRGESVSDKAVLAEILPCFKERDGMKTDAIALACTHYPLLMDVYRRVAPWEVAWIDPAPAIAKQVETVLARQMVCPEQGEAHHFLSGLACFTSGRQPTAPLAAMLAKRNLKATQSFLLPFARLSGCARLSS